MEIAGKLASPIEGALAAGGDPATSPLYVFGPFFRLLVPAGVASVAYGASLWLVVVTVVTVSWIYRRVLAWVADGTGGSGLSEDEFGAWAGKLAAAITITEYTLTWLVSMAALVTLLADRLPALTGDGRLAVAVFLTVTTAFLVNRGPRVAAATFGPATAGVLLLLWGLMGAVVVKTGLVLPPFEPMAFAPETIGFTLGGFARILALMTGIEVFANLVAAYSGSPSERARKAFGSLTIVMGSTTAALLILGPAIFRYADPLRGDVSVFTQMMDAVLPSGLSRIGTGIGAAVLLSACATAAQGLQNLGHGLALRHYLPESLAARNRFDVAARPVWLAAAICSLCFVLFGTREETYLALYAAGVFVLLAMTAWACVRRLRRDDGPRSLALLGALLAAGLTSLATVIVFVERFSEGAWSYLLLLPVLYGVLSWVRSQRGPPSTRCDRLGRGVACSCPGLGAPTVSSRPA